MSARTGKSWTPAQITEGLIALVATGGNAAEAERALAGTDAPIPAVTLRRWRNDEHVEQYRRLELNYAQEIEQQLVAIARDNAREAARATREAIDLAAEQIRSGKIKDPAQAALNLSKVTGQSVQEVLRLTGRPTENPNSQGLAELVIGLIDRGILKAPADLPLRADADGQAVEIETRSP